jgi:hypothetical protein
MTSSDARRSDRCRALLTSSLGSCFLLVAAAAPAERLAFEGRRVASAEELASMRGGFVGTIGGQKLDLAFGIERVVSIDGEIVGSTRFRIPSLASLQALRALPTHALQSGPGNQVSADVAAAVGANLAVIQNSLDGQVLRQVTTIDASVRNLEAFRAARFGAALSQQFVMSLR